MLNAIYQRSLYLYLRNKLNNVEVANLEFNTKNKYRNIFKLPCTHKKTRPAWAQMAHFRMTHLTMSYSSLIRPMCPRANQTTVVWILKRWNQAPTRPKFCNCPTWYTQGIQISRLLAAAVQMRLYDFQYPDTLCKILYSSNLGKYSEHIQGQLNLSLVSRKSDYFLLLVAGVRVRLLEGIL